MQTSHQQNYIIKKTKLINLTRRAARNPIKLKRANVTHFCFIFLVGRIIIYTTPIPRTKEDFSWIRARRDCAHSLRRARNKVSQMRDKETVWLAASR